MTIRETAEFLRGHDRYLILTHRRPDGDTLGCAAALCALLRANGKEAGVLPNPEVSDRYLPVIAPYYAAPEAPYDTVVSVDIAALGLFPKGAEDLRDQVDLAIDHHPSYEQFGKKSLVDASAAACGEIVCALAEEFGALTREVALPLYIAVSTDTGCFVYSNVTEQTHIVAAKLIATGIDFRSANKLYFRTKSKKRLELENALYGGMKFYDDGRIVVLKFPLSLANTLQLNESDAEDIAGLGGVIEGTDCSVMMRESDEGWKVSLRCGARVNATLACSYLGGGGHRAASGCMIRTHDAEAAEKMILDAIARAIKEEAENA